MATLLVTYDLNKEVDRPNLPDEIKRLSDGWARLSESSYAIRTDLTPKAVFDKLSMHLDGNDNFYVITLAEPYYGQGPEAVNKWLADKL